jgi:hypothetical protein
VKTALQGLVSMGCFVDKLWDFFVEVTSNLRWITYTALTFWGSQQWMLWTCMNAVMRKCDVVEGVPMSASDSDGLVVQVAKLQSDVQHIQADVTDIKADVRVRFEKVDQKIDSLRENMEARFESSRKDIDARFDKIDKRFDWALKLYFGLAAGLLSLIAHAFKWI